MNGSPPLAPLARLGLRLIAVWIVAQALWQGLANLADSLPAFDPSYLGFYLRTQLLSPFLGIVVGSTLFALAGRLSRRVAGETGPAPRA